MKFKVTDRIPQETELLLCGKENTEPDGIERRVCPPVRDGDGAFDEETLLAALRAAIEDAVKEGKTEITLDGDSFIGDPEETSYVRSVLAECLAAIRDVSAHVFVVYRKREADEALIARLDRSLRTPVLCMIRQSFGDEDDPVIKKFEKFNAQLEKSASFHDMFLQLLSTRTFRKNSEIYRLCGISKITFSRIMNYKAGHRPSKETVGAIAIGLQLDLKTAQELYHSAGYHLGTTEFTDRVIRFFLEEGPCNINEVNDCLDYYGLPLLGEHGRDDAIDL